MACMDFAFQIGGTHPNPVNSRRLRQMLHFVRDCREDAPGSAVFEELIACGHAVTIKVRHAARV